MEDILNGHFFSPTQGNLTLDEVVAELFSHMLKKPESFYEIIVGCDSSSEEEPNFPLAVVILRKGEGGRFFLKRIKYPSSANKRFVHWKSRILNEVLLSCALALSLREKIQIKAAQVSEPLNYQFLYIHADVGENGQTKDMIKEVVGLIKGNGFEAKIKPESYAASVVADRYS
ncbi:MAG: hypothetical protein A2896_00785 [Candidatus Nealsonbacteria bacterium RIFCSPLOWO2_01_FULL_43_32]|uniref:DUF458 domain-containing protein n=1 Tax=Candidatus Nealsonbacteria bacterium RIFCSPLOWO2_01_FULL_43_32 TaxID=1801672 RepID=A0A1G2EGZ4_9BACT|nr:MAG: hypothetical protein A2896_00785 [Candidatus Nealsonbacteria bacterium RIFCSPLOWO2_01_FULL_43_32]